MKIRGKKLRNVIIVASLITVVLGVSLFCGLFFGLRSQPESVFARAAENWEKADSKITTDDFKLNLSIGEPAKNIDLVFNMSGTRKELPDGYAELTYNVRVEYMLAISEKPLPIIILNGIFKVNVTPDNYTVGFYPDKKESMVEMDDWETTVSADTIESYSAVDFMSFTVYDTSSITIGKTGEYHIAGAASVSGLKRYLAPLANSVSEIDVMGLINQYLLPGDVRGKFTYRGKPYSGKVAFGEVTSTQSYSVLIPWDVVDREAGKFEMSGMIGEIFTTKKISYGSISIDLMDYCPNGFRMTGTLTSKSTTK